MATVNTTTASGSKELELGDLRTLANELAVVAGAWDDLGLELGMDQGIIDGLKGHYKPPKACLKDMLQERIEQGGLTWDIIIQALSEGLAKNLPLARKLKAKYGTQTGQEQAMETEERREGEMQPLEQQIQEAGGLDDVPHREVNEPRQEAPQQAPIQETRPAGQDTQSPFQETGLPVQETQPQANGAVADCERRWFLGGGVEGKLKVDGTELDITRYPAFQISDSKKKKSIALSYKDVKINTGKTLKHSPYPMERSPHGVAVIINNERFDTASLKIRAGTAVDEENLVQTFRYLCYNVEVYRNCTSAQIMEVLGDMQRRDHSNFDSFVCCILSHGKEGKVFGSDGKPVVLTEVTALLNARNCKSLARKPKMFFIQACRGTIKDPVVRIESDSSDVSSQNVEVDGGSDQPWNMPSEQDFLFSYATPLGRVAIRHMDYGSWYVSELCQVLCESSRYLHLDDMLKDVHRNVAQKVYYKPSKSNPDEEVEYGQAGEETHRLPHNIYFF